MQGDRTMMLLTKANKTALPALLSQDGKGKQAIAHVKFFGGSDWSFYASEFGDRGDESEFFGLWITSQGSELCSLSMAQLQSMRFRPFNLPAERDRYFKPRTLQECEDKKP